MATQIYSLDLELGSSQFAAITDASQTGLDITGNLTIMAWVKIESAPGGSFYTVAGKWRQDTDNRSYALDYDGTNLRLLGSSDGSSAGNATKAATVTVGAWKHVAVKYTAAAGSAEFFVDGVSLGSATGTLPTSLFNGAADFAIGKIFTTVNANFFDGLIDEVVVVAGLFDVATYYNKIFTPTSDVKGYWRLENDYTDTSGNGNTLTASGSPVFSTDVQALIDNTVQSDTQGFFLA